MTKRICYAVALVAVVVGVGVSLLPVHDTFGQSCGVAWMAAFGFGHSTECPGLGRRRLFMIAVASATVALSALCVAYVFRDGDDVH